MMRAMRRALALLLALALVGCLAPAAALGALSLSEGRVEVLAADSGSVTATVGIPDNGGVDVAQVRVAVVGVPTGAAESWISSSPSPPDPVTPPVDVPFTLTVSVPPGTPGGTYPFQLAGVADGAEVGRASLDVAVPGAAGCTGPELTVDRATFRPRWRQSRLGGTLLLDGRICQATTLSVTLTRRGARPSRPIAANVARLGLRARVTGLPAGLLPGSYTVQVEGTGAGLGTVERSVASTLPPPPEGVVRSAFASGIRNGPRAVTLPGRRPIIYATFRFAALPARGQRVTTTWVSPSGDATRPVLRNRTATIEAFVQAVPGRSLATGRWRCVLRAGGRTVRVLSVSVGD